MNKLSNKLYKLMDWPKIEAIIYSEENRPHDILGPHATGNATLLQTFKPKAQKVVAAIKDLKDPYKLATYNMSLADEEGFFACLIPGKNINHYTLIITDENDKETEIHDAYAFTPDFLTERDLSKFRAGINYTIYEKMGAHPRTINGVMGTNFAVWAPNALRVSVVGDFNDWDGRIHQMSQLDKEGIFEIFIPGVCANDLYKFEIKSPGGFITLKADPYAFGSQLRPETASIVRDLKKFAWDDKEWLSIRASRQSKEAPINIYELHLGSFKRNSDLNNRCYLNYRELAPLIIEYVKKMRYTHIQLMPIMEHYDDDSLGYRITGFYAPTARYGDAEDFMYFVNEMHLNNIGVLLDWPASSFPNDYFALANFDSTCLYEHLDPRQGINPQNGSLFFNYGRPEVSNFLIANALYWVEKFHLDGLKISEMNAMLYLDYRKSAGEWIANMYGGNENLEAVEMLKHLNAVIKKRNPGILTIADETLSWPMVTGSLKEGGLGFSFKWNNGWRSDYLRYIDFDPYFRAHHHPELTFSMIYAYSEKFMLAFSHQEVTDGKSGMIGKMPGRIKDKFANLRLTYAYQIMHPGKKLLFMGQDLAEFREFEEKREIQWALLEHEEHKQLNLLMQELNDFYRLNPALFCLDDNPAGFCWLNCISAEKCMLSFMRLSKKEEERLFVIANFANIKQDFEIGVPLEGKYREVFNTDESRFGGSGRTNNIAIEAKEKEADDFPYSFTMTSAPLSLQVFKYEPYTEEEQEILLKKKEAQIKKRLAEEIAAAKRKAQQELSKAGKPKTKGG
ncbi:MAG: 1,4-alpha-glucan branching protein GlgB [Lachnospiraceae bacterium]|nr:1,4-alpha-glucan branching protein GlgB [Lachnospiraceae bacterium]